MFGGLIQNRFKQITMDYVEALGNALLNAEADEKIRIAQALKELEDSKAEPYLLKALNNPDKRVRHAAAYALSFVATPMSESKLIQLLDDKHFAVRTYAAYGLAHIRSRAALPKLIEALGDEEWGVAAAAVCALGEIGDADAVGPLVELLQDRGHVYGALRSLGAIGCLDAADAVVGCLDDSDETTRTFALIALKGIPDAIPVAKLEELIEKESSTVNKSLARNLIHRRKNARTRSHGLS